MLHVCARLQHCRSALEALSEVFLHWCLRLKSHNLLVACLLSARTAHTFCPTKASPVDRCVHAVQLHYACSVSATVMLHARIARVHCQFTYCHCKEGCIPVRLDPARMLTPSLSFNTCTFVRTAVCAAAFLVAFLHFLAAAEGVSMLQAIRGRPLLVCGRLVLVASPLCLHHSR